MLKYKIAVCAGVFLAGMAAGWFLNSRLLPEADRISGRPPSVDTLQSRAWPTEDIRDIFKPREYIKINRKPEDGGLLEQP